MSSSRIPAFRALVMGSITAGVTACGAARPSPSTSASVVPCGQTPSGATIACGDHNITWSWGYDVWQQPGNHDFGEIGYFPDGYTSWHNTLIIDETAHFHGCLVKGPHLTLPFGGHVAAELAVIPMGNPNSKVFDYELTADGGAQVLAQGSYVSNGNYGVATLALAADVGPLHDVELRVCNIEAAGYAAVGYANLTLIY